MNDAPPARPAFGRRPPASPSLDVAGDPAADERVAGRSSRAWPGVLKGAGWAILAALAFAGLSGDLTMLGLLLFILPGLVLLAAPTVFLYAALLQFPKGVWNGTRSWPATLAALGLIVGLACIPALYVTGELEAQAAAQTRGDFGSPPPPAEWRSIAIIGPKPGCDDLCERLLNEGVVSEVFYRSFQAGPSDLAGGIGAAAAYRVGDAEECARVGGSPALGQDGCILRTTAANAAAPVIVVEAPAIRAPGFAIKERGPGRWDPLALGSWSYRPLEIWTCLGDRCTKVMRRTEVRQRRVRMPLWVGSDGYGGGSLKMWREWARGDFTRNLFTLEGAVDSLTRTGPKTPVALGVKPPRRLPQVVPLAVGADDPGTLAVMIDSWNRQTTPWSQRQIEALGEILDNPPERWPNVRWNAHPEAADALADKLVTLLTGPYDGARLRFAQEGVSYLSPAVYRRVGPRIERWFDQDRFHWTDRDAGFLGRLSELGPDVTTPLAKLIDHGDDLPRVNNREAYAIVLALCRTGREAQAAAPALERVLGRLRARNVDSPYARMLALTVQRLNTGAPGVEACWDLAATDKGLYPAWIARARLADL